MVSITAFHGKRSFAMRITIDIPDDTHILCINAFHGAEGEEEVQTLFYREPQDADRIDMTKEEVLQ